MGLGNDSEGAEQEVLHREEAGRKSEKNGAGFTGCKITGKPCTERHTSTTLSVQEIVCSYPGGTGNQIQRTLNEHNRSPLKICPSFPSHVLSTSPAPAPGLFLLTD